MRPQIAILGFAVVVLAVAACSVVVFGNRYLGILVDENLNRD